MVRTDLVIREATSRDGRAIGPLSAELGYTASSAETVARLNRVLDAPGHRVLVAESPDEGIVGWVHVFGTLRVESAPFAELGGLVVSEGFRGRGAGTRLVNAAEQWAWDNGFYTLRARSRNERGGAHAFYENLGFECSKIQKVFDRSLQGNS
jgi:GNAT superfamily N-acetyltransferase